MRSQLRAILAGAIALFAFLHAPHSPLRLFENATRPAGGLHPAGWNREKGEVGARVIYGDDNRVDIEDVGEAAVRELARSTAAIVALSELKADGSGRSRLQSFEYGTSYNLCRAERFYPQPIAADCTAFLVAPDIVATAGHCVGSIKKCQNQAYVFSFEIDSASRDSTIIDNEDIYTCRELIGTQVPPRGSDWALVRLNRSVTGRRPLTLRQSGAISTGEDLFVIGHPAGLPKKVAGGAQVRATHDPLWFSAELDTYGGNSGSPVFNAHTHEVEGILVRGEVDFEVDSKDPNSCLRSKVCAPGTCNGEEVTRISEILPRLPTF